MHSNCWAPIVSWVPIVERHLIAAKNTSTTMPGSWARAWPFTFLRLLLVMTIVVRRFTAPWPRSSSGFRLFLMWLLLFRWFMAWWWAFLWLCAVIGWGGSGNAVWWFSWVRTVRSVTVSWWLCFRWAIFIAITSRCWSIVFNVSSGCRTIFYIPMIWFWLVRVSSGWSFVVFRMRFCSIVRGRGFVTLQTIHWFTTSRFVTVWCFALIIGWLGIAIMNIMNVIDAGRWLIFITAMNTATNHGECYVVLLFFDVISLIFRLLSQFVFLVFGRICGDKKQYRHYMQCLNGNTGRMNLLMTLA